MKKSAPRHGVPIFFTPKSLGSGRGVGTLPNLSKLHNRCSPKLGELSQRD